MGYVRNMASLVVLGKRTALCMLLEVLEKNWSGISAFSFCLADAFVGCEMLQSITSIDLCF